MGMAASQARLLNLTARRSNIEYQGQQINEQRTSLSNQSANLYNQMLSLRVPTPPNSQEFTKVTYNFAIPGTYNNQATISQITPILDPNGDPTGTYTVSYAYTSSELGFPACSDEKKPIVTDHMVDVPDSGTPPLQTYQITTSSGKTLLLTKYDENDPNQKKIHDDAARTLGAGTTSFGDLYFVNVGTEAAPKYEYYSGAELAKCILPAKTQDRATYYIAAEVETYHEESYSPCTISRDGYNRIQSFTHIPEDGSPTTYSVTTSTITDDEAYNDAMNEYTYQNYLYEQEMANINAQTSIIQVQDRTLELQLKQLDTEHNAINNEMEAVKGVCKKNVEDSFKTFA